MWPLSLECHTGYISKSRGGCIVSLTSSQVFSPWEKAPQASREKLLLQWIYTLYHYRNRQRNVCIEI